MTNRANRPGWSTLRRPAAIAAVAAAALLATACSPVGNTSGDAPNPTSGKTGDSYGSPANASEIKKGGELVMTLAAEPDMLDPTLSRSLYTRIVFHAMCEKLYDVNEKTEIVPQLASALPKISDGGKTVTIPVREGIKFADGTDFNAEAVKATFDRNLTLEGSGRKSELGPVESVEATDAKTVVVKLSKPFAPLTAALSDRAGAIMSPKAIKELGDKFATAPACVGAFKFKEHVPANSITLEKDPNYYDADKVNFDTITYQILTDASIRAANLRSGDVQVADTLSPQNVPDLDKDSSLAVLRASSLGYQGLTFNVGNTDGVGTPAGKIDTPLAQNPKIRQAFELALDREALIKVVFNDLYNVACSPIAPQSIFSTPASQECTPHDPAKAKELLTEAGVQTPFKLKMSVSNNPDSMRLAQALQSMVKDGGFELEILPVEYTTLLDQQDAGDFEMLALGWSGRVDPDANITNFVGTGGSQNVAGFNDPAVDGLLEKARVEQDPKVRADLYAQVVAKLHEANPLIYTHRLVTMTGVSNTVKGVQVFPDGIVRVAFAGFAK